MVLANRTVEELPAHAVGGDLNQSVTAIFAGL